MRFLSGPEEQQASSWMQEASLLARQALCLEAKCGTVIIKDGAIIGRGYNAPPRDDVSQRMCNQEYDHSKKQKSDRTCCVHAEWRAIFDACKNNPNKIAGSQLFFTRVDEAGNMKRSGQPYCTVCSRLALDVGITEFHLWQKEGIAAYPTDEYNQLSYSFFNPSK